MPSASESVVEDFPIGRDVRVFRAPGVGVGGRFLFCSHNCRDLGRRNLEADTTVQCASQLATRAKSGLLSSNVLTGRARH